MSDHDTSFGYPPGFEIGYTQITTSANVTDTSESTATALITAGPFTFDGGPVICEFYGICVPDTNSVDDALIISLFEASTQITRLVNQKSDITSTAGTFTAYARYRFTPTTGLHTYKITAFVPSTVGTPTIAGGTGGTAASPSAFVCFTKV